MQLSKDPAGIADAFDRIRVAHPFLGAVVNPKVVRAAGEGDHCAFLIGEAHSGAMRLYSAGDVGGVRGLIDRFRDQISVEAGFVPYGMEQTYPGEVGHMLDLVARSSWVWMSARTAPPRQPGEQYCGPLGDDEIEEAADVARHSNPHSHRQPGQDDLVWWGYRDDDGVLLSVCALSFESEGVNLGGFGTRPEARGRGVGTAMMSAITRWGVKNHGLVHYGVWMDNIGAIRIYRRLGYSIGAEVQDYTKPEPGE